MIPGRGPSLASGLTVGRTEAFQAKEQSYRKTSLLEMTIEESLKAKPPQGETPEVSFLVVTSSVTRLL